MIRRRSSFGGANLAVVASRSLDRTQPRPAFLAPSLVSARGCGQELQCVDLVSTRGSELGFGYSIPQYKVLLRYINQNPFQVVVERVGLRDLVRSADNQGSTVVAVCRSGSQSRTGDLYGQHLPAYEPGTHVEFQLDANQTKHIETQMVDRRLTQDMIISFGKALGQEFVTDLQRINIPKHEVGGQG